MRSPEPASTSTSSSIAPSSPAPSSRRPLSRSRCPRSRRSTFAPTPSRSFSDCWSSPAWWSDSTSARATTGRGTSKPPPSSSPSRSRPTGAEIWVDGIPTGKYTTSILNWDNHVAHTLLLKQEGRAETTQEIPAGQLEGVVAIDMAAVGHVKVTSQPAGARLSSPTQALGTTPCTVNVLTEVPTKLTASLDGYLDQNTTVTVAAGETFQWSPVLVPAGQLEVVSDPSEAHVQIDGVAVGKTPLKAFVAAATPHLVLVEAPGIDPYRTTATVAAGKVKHLVARLSDKEERKLQALLKQVNRELDDLDRQHRSLEGTQPNEYFASMANLKKRTAIETKMDKLSKRRDDLEGQIDARRTELEDRAASTK